MDGVAGVSGAEAQTPPASDAMVTCVNTMNVLASKLVPMIDKMPLWADKIHEHDKSLAILQARQDGYKVVVPEMRPQWEARLEILRQTIHECFEYPDEGKPITEIRLFYNGYDDSSNSKKRKRESYDSVM